MEYFLDSRKETIVISISKFSQVEYYNDQGLIVLLSLLASALESVVYEQRYNYLKSNQSGFRSGYRSSIVVIELNSPLHIQIELKIQQVE